MTENERIERLKQALISARYSLVWWAHHPAFSFKRERCLQKELAKYDETIDAELLIGS